MQVSFPISEAPENEDLISGQTAETSCPTSLVFSDTSERLSLCTQASQMQHKRPRNSGGRRQGEYSCMPGPHRKPVKGDATSSLLFNEASEQALHSSFSDATLKTMKEWGKRRQKSRGTTCARQVPRGKLGIPEHLHTFAQGAPVPARILCLYIFYMNICIIKK